MTLVADLAMNPGPGGRYNWIRANYWSPFEHQGLTGARSRMAVSAQVVLVTGDMPDDATGDGLNGGNPAIYSINFSWGTMDRSWRWRALPPAQARRFAEPITGDETIPALPAESIYPQTIRLRDDMTIHLKGRHLGVLGRWCQRYLPASNQLVPPAGELTAGSQPHLGYTHH